MGNSASQPSDQHLSDQDIEKEIEKNTALEQELEQGAKRTNSDSDSHSHNSDPSEETHLTQAPRRPAPRANRVCAVFAEPEEDPFSGKKRIVKPVDLFDPPPIVFDSIEMSDSSPPKSAPLIELPEAKSDGPSWGNAGLDAQAHAPTTPRPTYSKLMSMTRFSTDSDAPTTAAAPNAPAPAASVASSAPRAKAAANPASQFFASLHTLQHQQLAYPVKPPPPSNTTLAKIFRAEDNLMNATPETIRDTLLTLDLFPYLPSPTIGGLVGHRSLVGVIGTIVMIAILLWFVSNSTQTFIQRAKPAVVQKQIPLSRTTLFPVEVGYALQSNNNPYSNLSIIRLEMRIDGVNRGADGKSTKFKTIIPVDDCDFSDLSIAFKSASCPWGYIQDANNKTVKQTRQPQTIIGDFTSPRYWYIVIEGHLCDPKKVPVPCEKDQNILDSVWRTLTLNILMPERKTIDNPKLDTYYFSYVGYGWMTKTDILMQKNTILDYSPVIFGFEPVRNDTYWSLQSTDARNLFIEPDTPTRIWKGNVRIGDWQFTEFRNFATVADLLASWGGFFTLLTGVFSLIFLKYNTLKFQQYRTWDLDPDFSGPHKVIKVDLVPVDENGNVIRTFKAPIAPGQAPPGSH
eukprot:TRINITY_DN2633_c0_g1_i2.p1 TRINITY_DN2633_c0_g1~~TRINITY_DN2633_c0_g1_i2.p1  ORF type:complete len:627 (+),score=170.86 TRINITY_DN2633_c0_g1_i2:80-1960(+)